MTHTHHAGWAQRIQGSVWNQTLMVCTHKNPIRSSTWTAFHRHPCKGLCLQNQHLRLSCRSTALDPLTSHTRSASCQVLYEGLDGADPDADHTPLPSTSSRNHDVAPQHAGTGVSDAKSAQALDAPAQAKQLTHSPPAATRRSSVKDMTEVRTRPTAQATTSRTSERETMLTQPLTHTRSDRRPSCL